MRRISPPLERRDGLMALGLAALVVLAGLLRMAPGVCGYYHDDAIYVSTARALAEGEGYRLSGVPGAPLQTKYPFLYPAVLASVWRLWPDFPGNLPVMQLLTLLCGAAAIASSYLYLVRFGYCQRGLAASGAMLCGTASYFLYFCVTTMAEMPFVLLMIAALWSLDAQLAGASASRRARFGLGIVLAMPFLCRTIGAVFVVAGLMALWRARRPVFLTLCGAATAALPWVLWALLGRGAFDRNPIDGYYTDYMGCWSSTSLQLAGNVLVRNSLWVLLDSGRLGCEGVSDATASLLGPVPQILFFMILGSAPWIMLLPALRQERPLAWGLALYLLLIVVWPWHPCRFLVPVLPFLTVYLLMGLAELLKRLPGRIRLQPVLATGLGVLVLGNLALLSRQAQITAESGFPLASVRHTRVDWAAYERTFSWVRQHAGARDVVACGLDSMAALYTQRQAFRPFVYNPAGIFYGDGAPHLMTAEELAAVLKRGRPQYLLQTPMPGFSEEGLFSDVIAELQRQYPDWLSIVYQDSDPRFVVFKLNDQKNPGSTSARGADVTLGD